MQIKLTQKKIVTIIVLSLLTLIGVILNLATPKTPKPIITNPNISPTVSPIPPSTEKPLTNINWSQNQTLSLPTNSNQYQIKLTSLAEYADSISKNLKFSKPAQVNQFKTYNFINSTHSLSINPNNFEIIYTNLEPNYIATQGAFLKTKDELVSQTIQTVKSLNIFDSQFEFIHSNTEYFATGPTYYQPSTASFANLINISLTPATDNIPIYLDNQQEFIQAVYDKESKLIKLKINFPIKTITKTNQTVTLISQDKLKSLSLDQFFPLQINKSSFSDYYLSSPQISRITARQTSQGFLLDTKQSNQLKPIFIINTSNKHLFAASAISTNN